MIARILTGLAAILLVAAVPLASADERDGHGKGGKEGYGEHGMGKGRHGGAGHFLRHLLMHQKEIGLTEDQVAKIKAIQLDLDKTRTRTEADAQAAERELHAMVQDDKSDLAAIEAKLKQTSSLAVGLRLAAIKAKREALALLTPEQREKEKAEREKMMKMMEQRRMGEMGGMGQGDGHGGPAEPKKEPDKKEEQHGH